MFLRLRHAAALIALCGATAFAASHAGADKGSTWEDIKAWSHEKKTDAVAAGKKMLAATDEKIKELEAQAKKSGNETQAAHQKNMKELKAQRDAAAKKLEQLEKASATAWNGTRDAFAAAYKDLTDSHAKASAAPAAKK